MIIKLRIPWWRIARDLKAPMVFIIIYMIIISVVDQFFYPLEDVMVPLTIITVPGTVIALLLGFRTNSAYDRWWEARKIWGAIVNDSRTWVRQLMTLTDFDLGKNDDVKMLRRMAIRQVAWNYALSRHLRKQKVIESIESFLDNAEIEDLKTKSNIPNALLFHQGQEVKELFVQGKINAYQQVQLDATLVRLTDAMGKCERIKNTVFPASYSLLVDLLIYLWIIFLPFGLVDMDSWILLSTTISLAFSFLVIDKIAIYMQDPFENFATDTPMLSLSRTIEINIRQELDDQEIPEPIHPENGVLM